MDSIKEQIFQLENDLIKSEVRKSAESNKKGLAFKIIMSN